MKGTSTISWIFLSIAVASEQEAVDYKAIMSIADGINHAIPTDKEMQTSIKWLLSKGLIIKEAKRYKLADSGLEIYNYAQIGIKTYNDILEAVEKKLSANHE